MTGPVEIPDLSLVALVGASGSGKSSFARRNFLPTEILSSDFFRGLVSNDENSQEASREAFEVLYYVLEKRLAAGLLTVVDATNVRREDREGLIQAARKHHCMAVALVLDLPREVCEARNRERPERRAMGAHVVGRHIRELRHGLHGLEREGFRHVWVMRSVEEVDAFRITRRPLWPDRRGDSGPFDIVGDVHGCCDELEELLERLGYAGGRHPEGRKAVFLGDLVDRGPRVVDTVRLVRSMCDAGSALCVPGNHDTKLARWMNGRQVQVKHGLEQSIAEIEPLPGPDKRALREFLESLVSHYVLDGGALVVAHAGLKREMQGRASGAVREFCLYGETTGETDEFGLPVRHNWAAEYRGRAAVVYGHTPVPQAEWLNNTINIDTGCVFGGSLTALRWPERELVSVQARREYAVPARPFLVPPARAAQHAVDDILDLEDVVGKRVVSTRLARNVTIREENSIAALEVMSRFSCDPHWLIYLPPTMSPCETSQRPDALEYPTEALDYFHRNGVARVVCEEKHMGSRVVVVACRDEAAAQARFGVVGDAVGACYTRTSRPYFGDPVLERQFLDRLRAAIDRAGWWAKLSTDWVCMDCELMPWSAKAMMLIERQYAAAGAAGEAMLSRAVDLAGRTPTAGDLCAHAASRLDLMVRFREAYRRYCWPVRGLEGYKLAPFHLLATEGVHYFDRTHAWHMSMLAGLAAADPEFLVATPCREVDLGDPANRQAAVDWWESLTARGGEGMVVKPMDFIARGPKGAVQPALKCRGREYLRIIYGPEYTLPDQIERLRARGLSGKRSLAWREFALGVEAVERFLAREPLRRVHECVFGVLALESEPVDPRL